MKELGNLMQTAFDRIAVLLKSRWTGEITIRIQINQGGIRNAKIKEDYPLTFKG